jgi:hypothetical protein
MKTRILLTLLPLFLAGCIVPYQLKKAGPTTVSNGAFTVNPSTAWNVVPKDASRTEWEEVWTQNGPMLDTIAFLGGMPEGKTILVQKKKDEKQVPLFRPNMTPQDLASMVEASYRVRGVTVFNTESVDPVSFLGGQGIKVRFNYAPSNGITKNGSCVLRVIDKKLYVMKLEGVSSHYFEASMPEFDRLVASASLPTK